MNKNILTLVLAFLSLLLFSSDGFCDNAKINNPASPNTKASKQILKTSAEDSKAQYINRDWWDKFHDPILKGYITKALKDNYDLKIATLKVEQANAAVQEYFGKELPGLDLGLNYSKSRTSGSISDYPASTRSGYIFPLVASYELDLWRKNREATIGKEKELESVKNYEKSSYISLCTTIATVYFNILNIDSQIELQQDIIELRKSILDMTKDNNQFGLLSATDVIQADRALSDSQSLMKDLKKRQSLLLNQLAVLTGQSSDNSANLKRANIDEVEMLSDLPAEVKSEVVLKRPDILKAEAELQKARIDVSLARKDFLPKFPIIGEFGFNSSTLSKSISWDSYIANIGVGISQSLFAGGQKRAVLKGKKYKYEEILQNYQKTILVSYQEVNDSLASLKFDNEKNNDNIERLNFEKDNLGIINNKYSLGAISLLDTLQYKERVYSLQKEQIQSKTDCLIDTLSLYKSVGGKF